MFEKIIGNEKNKTILKKALELKKTSHSYLFWGTEGIGKKKIALEFAKKDDIVLILGKGLENYQITNGKLVPRKNDAETAYYYIDELFGNKIN